MAKLKDLTKEEADHWKLHFKALKKDSPALAKEIDNYVKNKIGLPRLKHPSDIHDWFEKPEERASLELSNG